MQCFPQEGLFQVWSPLGWCSRSVLAEDQSEEQPWCSKEGVCVQVMVEQSMVCLENGKFQGRGNWWWGKWVPVLMARML